jgi:hypothetical protein
MLQELKNTIPVGFNLATSNRERKTSTVKSTEEKEENYVKTHCNKFKAKPVNAHVMSSSGDLGVPKVSLAGRTSRALHSTN